MGVERGCSSESQIPDELKATLVGHLESRGLPPIDYVVSKFADAITEAFETDGRFEVRSTGSPFLAGGWLVDFEPHVIVIVDSPPQIALNEILTRLSSNKRSSSVKLVGIATPEAETEESHCDTLLRRPVDADEVLQGVQELFQVADE